MTLKDLYLVFCPFNHPAIIYIFKKNTFRALELFSLAPVHSDRKRNQEAQVLTVAKRL